MKTQDAALLPRTRKLWFKVEPTAGKKLRKRGTGPASKEYELDFRECEAINSTLSDKQDVSGAKTLLCNTEPQCCFNGQMLGHEGFFLSPEEATVLIKDNARNTDVVHPTLIGRDLVTGPGYPTRWVIDFQERTILEAQTYNAPFEILRLKVLPDRERKAQEGRSADGEQRSHHKQFLRYWWRHSFDRPEMVKLLETMPRYIVCSDTTKRPIFQFVDRHIRADHKLRVFAFPDDYSFGILQSHAHWLWFITKCSKLTERFNYTSESVFNTFPWPQSPTPKQVEAVAEAGRKVRHVRTQALSEMDGGLRALYRTLELPGTNPLKDAHAALDATVLAAYGFNPKRDLLAQLLALNQAVAAKIESGEPVTAPGVPKNYPDPKKLVTEDCIKP